MRVGGLGGPRLAATPSGTPTTFANRFFQTTVFTANKPKFFSAGVAGLSCWGGGSGWIVPSVFRGVCPAQSLSGQGGGEGGGGGEVPWAGSDRGLGEARGCGGWKRS